MVQTTPEDDHDRKLLADIERHGWHLIGIDDDDDLPAYVFSVGIAHTLEQPELCIFGLNDTQTMAQIINAIGELMRSGETFDDWFESDEVLDGYSCMFRAVDPELYREYFGYALWFHEGPNFPMLQCVWPDRDHRYPWDDGFQAQSQPVLAMKTEWPFTEAKNLGVFTTRQVLEDGHPILLVTHDDDGDWQFLCGTTSDTDDCRLVGLEFMAEHDSSVADLADLPLGWQAFRDGPDEPWQRARQD